jgi:hypothetical protein
MWVNRYFDDMTNPGEAWLDSRSLRWASVGMTLLLRNGGEEE